MTPFPYTGRGMVRDQLTPAAVYTFRNFNGNAIYVGCTAQGFRRFTQHTAKSWWTEVASIDVLHFEEKADALRWERRLIRDLNPRHNQNGLMPAERKRRRSLEAA